MKKKTAIFCAPLRLLIGKKYYTVNFNSVMFQKSFHLKKAIRNEYKRILRQQIEPNLRMGKVNVTLVLYPPDNRRRDRNNVLMLHDKFFMDLLVDCGVLKDDNDSIVLSTTMITGEVDKVDPRVEIHVSEA